MSAAVCRQPIPQKLIRFDHDFIERRLREHREWQEQEAARCATEIISEVATALELAQQLRSGKGPQRVTRRLK